MILLFKLLRRLKPSSNSILNTALVFIMFSLATKNSCAQLSANFTMDKSKGCAPLYVNFSNTSTGNQDSCFWNLGINGNTSDDCNPSALYNVPGVYDVTLTIFKAGLTSTITKQITVFKDPQANFDATPKTGCVPFNVQFSDLSTTGDAPITNWLWDMGDGRTETGSNPLHTYTFSGNLTVSLIVTDANGCKNTLTIPDFIKKATPPVVDFTVSKSQTCLLPFSAVFQSTVTASTAVTYAWTFGNGNTSTLQNPTQLYTSPGNFNVSLTVKDLNNCTSIKTIPNAVKIEKFTVNASVPSPLCTNTSTLPTVTSTYSPIFCNWDLGDGSTSNQTTPTIAYTTPGSYEINLKATNQEGCRDSMTQTVDVNPAPKADFTADQLKSCVPFTVNFTNNSVDGSSYQWVIRGPNGFFTTNTSVNPSIALPHNGSYDVSLITTAANGCVDRLDLTKYIWIGPDQINATADKKEGCIDLSVQFNSNLTHNWTPKSVTWDFGDGTTGTGENPIHIYTKTGDYYIKVIAEYDAPCNSIESSIGPIHVGDKVPFNGTFDLDKVCVNQDMVTYNATGGRPTTEFVWLFGDGGTGSGRNTTHVYTDPSEPKTFYVQLVAINNYCKDTLDIKEIFVAYPKANFIYGTSCNSKTVEFENLSKGHTTATWYFGDGTTLVSMADKLSHTYPASMTQAEASLVVYNDVSGCTDTIVKKINFANTDSIGFNLSKNNGCSPLKVTLSMPANPDIDLFVWSLGDGRLGIGNNFVATYVNEGSYEVSVYVKYKSGCIVFSSVKDTVVVYRPRANFNMTGVSGCIPAIVSFKDSTKSINAAITSYTWKYNNVIFGTGPTASNTFSSVGTFPVKLVVQDEMGCKDSIIKDIVVSDVKADFDINVNDVCAGKPIQFINKSSLNALSYLWDFGDGTTSTDSLPIHTFSQEKNYTIKLTVSNGNGCVNTMTKNNFVRIKNIHVNFNASPTFKTCPDLISNFQLQAPANLEFKNIIWDFGNGNSSNDNNKTPQGVYTKSDSFDVKLIVIDTNNCTDTILKPNYIIVSGPQGSFDFVPDFGCAPFNVTFNAQFKNTTTTIWDFGNGDTKLDNTLSTSTTYTYKREGEYTPTLVLKDNYGCTVNIVSTKKVNVARLYTSFEVDKTTVCDGGDKIVILDSIYSTANSPISDYHWSITDALNNEIAGVGDTFSPSGPGSYLLKFYAENTFGCVSQKNITVGVYTKPLITGVEDKLICRGEQIPLSITGNPTVVEWSPSASLNVSTGMEVLARPDTSTQYIAKTYHYPQCPVYDTVKVAVVTTVSARAFPDTFVCIGDTVQLHAEASNTSLNISKIYWQNSEFISDVNDPNPSAYPNTNTTFYAIVENGACQSLKLPVKVDIKPLPSVKAGMDHIIIKGSEVEIDASSFDQVSYVWSPDYKLSCTECQTPMASPEMDTTYIVTAINEFGCKVKDNLRIQVIEDCSGKTVYVPNTFSPNGDGQNDVLRVLGPGVSSVKLFRVFNRWGQIVFDTNDPGLYWDGTFKGVLLNPGVYMYYMDVECINGQRTIKKGDITLLR